jgi:signal peptidase I
VWFKPRDTIGRILATNPRRHVLLLAALGGVSAIPVEWIDAGLADQLHDWPKLAPIIVLGAAAAIGVAGLYVSAFLLRWTGKLLGGRASSVELRAAAAWRAVPNVLGFAICIIALIGLKLLAAAGVFAAASPIVITALQWLAGLLGLWSLIVMMLMLARVQDFGFWRTIANMALGWFGWFVIPFVLAVIFRTFLFQPFNIPSGSMKPTLLIGDYLFVSKFSYGYTHYSLPFSPGLFLGRIWASEPQRGDVVVFRLPKDDSTNYILRVIGLPRDSIQMRDGALFLNGVPVKRERIDDFVESDNARGVRVKRWRETLPNGVSYETLDSQDNGFLDNTQVYVVPTDYYFMMGDNRDNAADSRVLSQVGYVPFTNLVGRAARIFYSVDRTSPTGQTTQRFDRIGTAVRQITPEGAEPAYGHHTAAISPLAHLSFAAARNAASPPPSMAARIPAIRSW